MASVEYPVPPDASALKACKELAQAVGGEVGAAIEKIQTLIYDYYNDVRDQAAGSFHTARRVATAGFVVLCVTVAYVMIVDLAVRLGRLDARGAEVMTVG